MRQGRLILSWSVWGLQCMRGSNDRALPRYSRSQARRMAVTRLDYARDANTTKCHLTGVHVE
jgi:hypothetical protein